MNRRSRLTSETPVITILLALLLAPGLAASGFETLQVNSPQSLAFARYVGSLKSPDPFAEPGVVGISIRASLPKLYKDADFVAIRKPAEDQQSEFALLLVGGDGTVKEEVIAPFLTDEKERREPPLPAITVTPVDYKFRYVGAVKTGGGQAFIYQISPRKNRPGQISGEIWIDSASGREVMLTGRVRTPLSCTGSVDFVRDTTLLNGSAYVRVTHLAFTVRRLGPAEVVVSEYLLYPLQPQNELRSQNPRY